MSLTVNAESTSLTPYLTPQQFLQRYDSRIVGELVSDVDNPVPATSLPTNTILLTCIMDACAIFESACTVGGRYAAGDINNLLAFNGGVSVGANRILTIISDITFQRLRERRGMNEDPMPSYLDSMIQLEGLKNGESNLSFVEPQTVAAVASVQILTQQNYWQERLLSNDTRFFGIGVDRLGYGGW